jgi:acyl carrier protein
MRMEIENKLREILLPVFGLDSIEEIKPEHSLVKDLDADSLDFIEIIQLVELNFGVVITQEEIMIGGKNFDSGGLFEDGKLTAGGEELLKKNFPGKTGDLKTGMTKVELFTLLTVRDLANIIIEEKGRNA